MATTNYEDALDAITFGITSLTSHNNDNDIRSSLSSGLKSSLSSSSSTSSTSSAAASSSSTGSANHTGFHGKPKNAGPARALQQQVKHQNGNSVTDTANDLTCPLCKKTLASPKVLNCLHAFCKQCLVIEMQTVSEFGDYNPSFINCPKCKQETMVTEGVDSLQDDYIIHNMLDMTAIQQAIQDCTSCDTSEKAEARCADCAQFLCNGCIKAHQTMRCFQGHQVVKFEEIKKSYERNLSENLGKSFDFGVPIHKPLFCKVHTKESLKFFCNTCQVPICSECVVNVHMQPMHQYERLGEAEAKNIEELEQLIESAKERIVECNGDLSQTLDQYYSRLQEKQEQTRSCIEETHATYKAILEKRKEDLMKELEEKHSQKELLVSDMHNNIEKSISQLNDLIDFVKRCLKNGNCSEILMLKSLIVNQLRHLTNNLPAVHNLDINLKFYKDQNLFQKAVLETYGRFVTDKEHKQRMLNSLTADRNLNVPDQQKQHQMQQMIQLQKQMELQKQQEWFMANMIKSQHSQTANQQQRIEKQPSVNSLGSPTTSLTDDWIRNIIKTGSQLDEQNVNHQFNMENQLRTSLSPQSSNSSNTNSNPWANSGQMNSLQQQQLMQNKQSNGDKYQLSLAQQQLMLANLQQSTYNSVPKQIARSNSPIHFQNMPNLNVFQQQQSNQQISRSNTPSNFVLSNQMANGASMIQHQDAEEFIPFGANSNRSTNCMTQNFNQLSKMMGGNMNDTTLVSNISELGFNQSTAGFSDIQTNDPSMSPTAQQLTSAIGTIGSAINPSVGGESTFAGNGNLNPPVRQSVKMTNMQIRTKFGTLGSGKTQFNSPHGFCLGIDEEIIIADTNNHRIQVFDKNGEYKYSFGSPGREEGQVWHPRKVTVMRDTGNIVICDRGNERSRMQIFTRTGKFVKKISIRYIDIVAGLAIAESGDIVAVDSVSPTVFRISEAGDLIKWFDCSDNMREPSDIAIKGHEYFICDFKGHCITVFSEDGAFLRRIGGENITNFPNGIDISDAGDVLVGDSHGNRFHVAVFTREGTMLNEFECPYVKVSRCCGLKITSEGYVVTLAKNNHHVLVLNTLYVS